MLQGWVWQGGQERVQVREHITDPISNFELSFPPMVAIY